MKAVYQSDDLYLIKIADEAYYYGNGTTMNNIGDSAVQFLRFNPYMEDVSEKEVKIPKRIVRYIEKHSDK